MTSTWWSAKARLRAARAAISIGALKSRPTTSAPVWSVSGVMVKDVIDFSSPRRFAGTLPPGGGGIKGAAFHALIFPFRRRHDDRPLFGGGQFRTIAATTAP